MNGLAIFESPKFGKVRTLERDGEPWFVGKDVAAALGYENPQRAIRNHVDDEDKRVVEMDTPGGRQPIILINESGLYSLILSSRHPIAKEFKHWVTSQVVAGTRQNGMYFVDELLENPDLVIQALQRLKSERAKNQIDEYRELDKSSVRSDLNNE